MFYHNINPTILEIGGFEIRYYGLIFVLGFLIGYFILVYLAKERKLGLSKDDIADLLLYLIIGIVAGGRLFYILFYNLKFYLLNPLEMFALWQGGLSFHGGLVGAAIAVLFFSKKKKVSFYELTDIIIVPAALGLAFGRIGNFLNGELYGRITNVPWAVKFKDAEGFRHPSQLYESLKNFFYVWCFMVYKKQKFAKRIFILEFCDNVWELKVFYRILQGTRPSAGIYNF